MQGNVFEINTKEDSSQSFIFGVLFYWQLDRVAQELALMAYNLSWEAFSTCLKKCLRALITWTYCANHSCSSFV